MIYLHPGGQSLEGWPDCWGRIVNPRNVSKRVADGRPWLLDNDAFSGFDGPRFWRALDKLKPYRDTCIGVVAPDVVGDAIATLSLFRSFAWRIRAAGFPVAYVGQDGAELFPMPPCDVLFIGGGTEWKLSTGADDLIRQAHRRGIHTHVGRVNSAKRIRHFQTMGVHSVDGTLNRFDPSRLRRVIEPALHQGRLPWSLCTSPQS